MIKTRLYKRDYEAVAWGVFFIWWGITEFLPSLPAGTGVLGIGLILLGLNAARHLSGIPTGHFSIMIGVLAVVWGALDLAGVFLNLPFEIPVFAILLLAMGAIVLIRAINGSRDESIGER